MNVGNLIVLILAIGSVLLTWQRTLPKQRLLTLLLIVVPIFFLSFRWAGYRQQIAEWSIALAISAVLNTLFWFVWGRRHPPGYQGDIIVVGKEDTD